MKINIYTVVTQHIKNGKRKKIWKKKIYVRYEHPP